MTQLLDSLDIELPSARGRKESPLLLSITRELTEADLPQMVEAKGSTTPALLRIRTAHHTLARLIAQGVADAEISAITGYSPSRISILKNDPSFKELIHYYNQQIEAKFLDTHERLARLGNSFVDELQERLEEDPKQFKPGQILEAAKFCFDRSVAPPKSAEGGKGGTGQQVNLSIQFVKPEPIPQSIPKVIDITPEKSEDDSK